MHSCETVWVKVLVSKGWLQYNGKIQTGGRGMVKDIEFSVSVITTL